MNTLDEDDDGLREVELLGRLNKLTKLAKEMEIIVAGHVNTIAMWRDYATRLAAKVDSLQLQLTRVEEERDNCISGSKGLVAINREYRALHSELKVIGGQAAYDRDRARDIAAQLEAECAACWGPVHSQLLNALRLGESGELETKLSEYLDLVVVDDAT